MRTHPVPSLPPTPSEPARGWLEHLSRQLKVALVAVLAAALYLSCMSSSTPGNDRAVPEFSLSQLSGETVTHERLKGRPTILNFFATWCGPCMAEMPEIKRFYAGLDGRDVGFYLVAAGSEHRLDIRRFVNEHQLTLPVLLDGELLFNAFGGTALPTTVFVDAHGHVVRIVRGMINERVLKRELAALENPDAAP